VLFAQRFWEPIQRGEVTLTFRRWKRLQVIAGRRYRTAAGILEVESVDVVDPMTITAADARAAGHADRDALLAELPKDDALPVYRIAFHLVPGPDPRDQLAANDELSAEDLAELDRRLARLDAASSHGPWTAAVLDVIARRPAVRAGDLADELGRERLPFKTDVRKLKNLGLTISLGTGYRLSPRGEAYRKARP
jgi:hypothetical protein